MDNLQHYIDLSTHGTEASLHHNSMIYMFIQILIHLFYYACEYLTDYNMDPNLL